MATSATTATSGAPPDPTFFAAPVLTLGTFASYAPMSHALPLGRLTPRWSVAGHFTAASIAGLPFFSAKVRVGPPFDASVPSFGLRFLMSPGFFRPQVFALSRLCPAEVTPPAQLSGLPGPVEGADVFAARIVFLRVTDPTSR